MRAFVQVLVALVALSITPAQAQTTSSEPIAAGLRQVDAYTLHSDKHLIDGYEAKTPDGGIRVVIEIPAGTNAKWEVDKQDGQLKWEFKHGKPRVVKFLPYPFNYGMVPQTLLPKELGGDGDPLDVVVLGPSLPRGTVTTTRIVGVLKLLDNGEQDDKLLAVLPGTPLGEVKNLADLKESFPGVLEIVKLWLTSYKGPGQMVFSRGYGDTAAAGSVIDASIAAYAKARN